MRGNSQIIPETQTPHMDRQERMADEYFSSME